MSRERLWASGSLLFFLLVTSFLQSQSNNLRRRYVWSHEVSAVVTNHNNSMQTRVYYGLFTFLNYSAFVVWGHVLAKKKHGYFIVVKIWGEDLLR